MGTGMPVWALVFTVVLLSVFIGWYVSRVRGARREEVKEREEKTN